MTRSIHFDRFYFGIKCSTNLISQSLLGFVYLRQPLIQPELEISNIYYFYLKYHVEMNKTPAFKIGKDSFKIFAEQFKNISKVSKNSKRNL